ncbi:3850_t:CDS:2 [Entrophospora sp. SA101]|nr:3850_t:CDS:2 [Entrophospora sp. SA101]
MTMSLFENNEEQDDQPLSFINHSDYDDDYDDGSLTDSSGNYLVSSIHTNELGSDNSLVIHDDVDTFFLSQSSRLSEDSGSIVSYPNSDVMNSLVATPEISYQDEHERKVPIMPAPVDENETDPPPIFIINNEC